MKLLAENSSSFRKSIDQSIQTDESIVCRYRNAVRLDDDYKNDQALKQYLLETSMREGAHTFLLLQYRGVEIYILDETSGMATGSLKSIDGCLTTAFCRMEGASQIAFESGGNTGSALTSYGQQAGMETFFFCPVDNIDLLESKIFDNQGSHLIGVEDRGKVKELTEVFAQTTGMRHVPEKSWRNAAAMFRGLYILELLLSEKKFDWLSQTVSAGFGPIGIYSVLEPFHAELQRVPRFLGVQQEENCPMFTLWKPAAIEQPGKEERKTGRLLTRVMYDETPQTYQTVAPLLQLLRKTNGDMLTVNQEEFNTFLRTSAEYGSLLQLLESHDISITLKSGEILEKTGLIALIGTLKAVETGTIKAGSRVLCCMTSGVSAADGRARPEISVRNTQEILQYAKSIAGGQ